MPCPANTTACPGESTHTALGVTRCYACRERAVPVLSPSDMKPRIEYVLHEQGLRATVRVLRGAVSVVSQWPGLCRAALMAAGVPCNAVLISGVSHA